MDALTPLMYAAMGGHTAVCDALLDAGAHPNAVDDRGWAPVSYAARGDHGATLRRLLDRGAAPGAPPGVRTAFSLWTRAPPTARRRRGTCCRRTPRTRSPTPTTRTSSRCRGRPTTGPARTATRSPSGTAADPDDGRRPTPRAAAAPRAATATTATPSAGVGGAATRNRTPIVIVVTSMRPCMGRGAPGLRRCALAAIARSLRARARPSSPMKKAYSLTPKLSRDVSLAPSAYLMTV